MPNMFAKCSSLEVLKIDNFNTSNLQNMWNMFANCTSLSDLDISQFDLRKVENMEGAFHNCLDSLIQKVMSQNEYLTKAILK